MDSDLNLTRDLVPAAFQITTQTQKISKQGFAQNVLPQRECRTQLDADEKRNAAPNVPTIFGNPQHKIYCYLVYCTRYPFALPPTIQRCNRNPNQWIGKMPVRAQRGGCICLSLPTLFSQVLATLEKSDSVCLGYDFSFA